MTTVRKKVKPVANSTPTQEASRNAPAAVKKELRQIFRDAFDELGGAKWLVKFVKEDPQNARSFVQAMSRLIPLEITGKDGVPFTVTILHADGTREDVAQKPLEGEAVRVLN